MNLQELIDALIKFCGKQALALAEISVQVSALEQMLKREPAFAQEYARVLQKEQKKSEKQRQEVEKCLLLLEGAVSKMIQ